MSKCTMCGKELLSGDSLWEQGICNHCYDEKIIKQYPFKQGVIDKDQQIAELKQQLEEKDKENKALKDVRSLKIVILRETQLHNLSNKECYLKGFENGVSESIRTFENTYGEDKTKIIEERDKYSSDIYKVGGGGINIKLKNCKSN